VKIAIRVDVGQEITAGGSFMPLSKMHIALCAGLTALVCFAATPLAAQSDFFSGKTILLYVGFSPGGGVDGEARIAARHLSRFIPGNPTILVKNMPGAGGIVLANHLFKGVEADGLTLAMPGRSGFLLSNIVKDKNVAFDLAKFAYIGGAGSTNSILWLRKDSGIADVAQLKAAKREIILGAWSARSQNAIVPKVLRQYEGWPFKVVHGYPGTNEVILAIERGEVDGLYSHQGSVPAHMVGNGTLIPIVQTFEEFPNVPTIASLITNPKEKALLDLLSAPSRIGLPLLAPPGIPADRLEILRQSYALMVKDKEYVEEAEKRGLPMGQPINGEELQKLIAQTLSSVPDDVLQEYLVLTETETKETQR
jgi:tripartite-type tricarboxylate transporter receptor subunit TctC